MKKNFKKVSFLNGLLVTLALSFFLPTAANAFCFSHHYSYSHYNSCKTRHHNYANRYLNRYNYTYNYGDYKKYLYHTNRVNYYGNLCNIVRNCTTCSSHHVNRNSYQANRYRRYINHYNRYANYNFNLFRLTGLSCYRIAGNLFRSKCNLFKTKLHHCLGGNNNNNGGNNNNNNNNGGNNNNNNNNNNGGTN